MLYRFNLKTVVLAINRHKKLNMTFENINSGITCDCLSKAKIDTTNEYVRRLRKDILEDKDFLTHWEKGIGQESNDCEMICSYKSVSVNQFKTEYEDQILNKYRTTFNINPKRGAHYLKFRLNEDAGLVKFAPEEDDKSHYNFFKADDFTLDKIVIIETVKFA